MADPLLKEPVEDGSESSVEGALAALTALGPEAGAPNHASAAAAIACWRMDPASTFTAD